MERICIFIYRLPYKLIDVVNPNRKPTPHVVGGRESPPN